LISSLLQHLGKYLKLYRREQVLSKTSTGHPEVLEVAVIIDLAIITSATA
jgi:hypothetical protein